MTSRFSLDVWTLELSVFTVFRPEFRVLMERALRDVRVARPHQFHIDSPLSISVVCHLNSGQKVNEYQLSFRVSINARGLYLFIGEQIWNYLVHPCKL